MANTGSPASPEPDDIERYLRAFLMDDRIRQLPKHLWKWLVTKKILPKRKYSSAQRYRFIWTEQGSPLIVGARSLAERVQRLYDDEGRGDVIVRSAMSYGEPSFESVLGELRDAGVDSVVLLPLYPQSAYSPTLAVIDAFWRAQGAIGWRPPSVVIDNYHDDPAYIAALAQSIRNVGYGPDAQAKLVFSFHAIPLKDEETGDTYRAQIAESVRLVAEQLGVSPDSITVSYQSVFGRDASKWTSPLTRDVLASWRDNGFQVVLACPGFSIDCLETLYDIPHEMVPALEGADRLPVADRANGDVQAACNTSGRFVWVPTLGASAVHAELLKSIVDKRLAAES